MNSSKNTILAVELLGAAAAIALPALSAIPLTAIAVREIILDVYEKRTALAEQIAQNELQSLGGYERAAADPEGYVAKAMRFYQAAMHGAAHANLRILARLVVGRDNQPFLPADEFLSYAPVLESLRFKELALIAEMVHQHKQRKTPPLDQTNDWSAVSRKVVPQLFSDADELEATVTGLSRTGFVVSTTTWGGLTWKITPILLALEDTVEFQFIVNDEIARKAACAAA